MVRLRTTVFGPGDRASHHFPHARSSWLAGNPVGRRIDCDRSITDERRQGDAESVRLAAWTRVFLVPVEVWRTFGLTRPCWQSRLRCAACRLRGRRRSRVPFPRFSCSGRPVLGRHNICRLEIHEMDQNHRTAYYADTRRQGSLSQMPEDCLQRRRERSWSGAERIESRHVLTSLLRQSLRQLAPDFASATIATSVSTKRHHHRAFIIGSQLDNGGAPGRYRHETLAPPPSNTEMSVASYHEDAGVELVSVTPEQAQTARMAWRRYGKGNHPAGLNFGDCFAYALAEVSEEPPSLQRRRLCPHGRGAGIRGATRPPGPEQAPGCTAA